VFSADLAGALEHATALRDAAAGRGPSPALADGLAGRALALSNLGRAYEAAEQARRALAVAREIGYRAGQVLALGQLSSPPGPAMTSTARCSWPGRPRRSPPA
jgi:hypothetical protein